VIAKYEIKLPRLSSLGEFGVWVFFSPFVTVFPIALNHAEIETVKICTQGAVHMCWHFETPPQEFFAVHYKNRSLCAETRDRGGLKYCEQRWKSCSTHGGQRDLESPGQIP